MTPSIPLLTRPAAADRQCGGQGCTFCETLVFPPRISGSETTIRVARRSSLIRADPPGALAQVKLQVTDRYKSRIGAAAIAARPVA